MEHLKEIIENLQLDTTITLADIPTIDLYMDQVIQLFESKYDTTKRTEDEKVLTKTMINNYAKGKVFFPIKNKKYSKEHLIILSLIYHLKGGLSINDIKTTLQGINRKIETGETNIESFYTNYLELFATNVESLKDDVYTIAEEVEQMNDELEKTLLITLLVNRSNMYRRVAEKLIDQL